MRSFLVCGTILFALTPVIGGESDKDQKSLQGKWAGRVKDREDVEFTISGKEWTLRAKDKDDVYFKGTFTLDPKSKPRAMDLKVEGGGGESEKFVGKTALAIYELSGDTLRWAAMEPGSDDRPSEFTDKGKAIFVEFKRVK